MTTPSIKLVVLGDSSVGKTSLLSYATKRFSRSHTPTVFDNYVMNFDAKGQAIVLSFWDTAGLAKYDQFRPLTYGHTDLFLLCFSVVDPASYNNVQSRWYPETAYFCPKTPLIVVGTKIDLRGTAQEASVTNRAGDRLAKTLHALQYLECSAKTGENLSTVFDAVISLALCTKKEGSGCCALL